MAASRQISTGPGNKLVKIIENYDRLLLLIDMEMVWGSALFHEQYADWSWPCERFFQSGSERIDGQMAFP